MIEITRSHLLPETRQFLREWLVWAEAGAGEHRYFKRFIGLCTPAERYDGDNGTAVYGDLLRAFGFGYPFGFNAYNQAWANDTQHLDPNRLAWVRANV